MKTQPATMPDAPDDLLEARRQIVSLCRKLESSLQTLRDKAAEGRRLKPQITLAERRIQALHVALRCLDDAIEGHQETTCNENQQQGEGEQWR